MRQKRMFADSEMRTLTHSSVECFQECRVKWDYRYNREIITTEPQTALDFGTAIHSGLEFWFRYGIAKGAVKAGVSRGAELGLISEDLCKVQAMIERYTEIYEEEAFEVVEVEKVFKVRLQNPRTLKYSRSFTYQGKIDGLVKMDKGYYILEHKTTASITDKYIDAIDLKAQIALYAMAMESEGYPIRGAIYDILEKPGIRMATGETEEEFEARKAALLAKSKTGKTTAQRKEAETPEAFLARCREKLTADSFRRVIVALDFDRKREALDNLWRTAQDMRNAKIYPTTGACVAFGKVCPYLNLCRAKGDIEKCADEYKYKRAHSELDAKPINVHIDLRKKT